MGTFIVGLILLAAVAAVVVKLVRNKIAGKSSCSCGSDCGACCHCNSGK